MGKKNNELKRRLIQKNRQNRRIPAFIIVKTRRKVVHNPHMRRWRNDKIGTRNWRAQLGTKERR